ncbi:MAG TPA: efflux RND transporter permease subunit [Gemmataceae bacterium]|nr:efflux RND transporter permease subunit [Gemmataceae bacterium]
MISRFFIDRPVFATVLSLLITLVGGIALVFLPIAQYPRITPPGVVVSISYPGASAQVVADTVAAPIEQAVNGVEGMLYMSSQMGNDGTYSLTVTFDVGTDLKTALVMVQNRVTQAMPQLPSQVQNQGITIRKKTPDILMIVNFYSPNGRYDDIYLSNYATINVKDELLRVPGVSDVTYQGERDYSIRCWLDPQKLAASKMTAMDVASAIRAQNLDAPVGQVGQPPASAHQGLQLPIDTLGRLHLPDEFDDIIVKIGPRGGGLRSTNPAASASGAAGGLTTGAASSMVSGGAGGASAGTSSSDDLTPTAPAPTSSPSTTPTTGSTTSSTSTASTTTTTVVTGATGGGNTPGGAMSGGGGTTGGGASSVGGATGSAPPIVSVADVNAGTEGVLTSTTLGRGPGLPAPAVVRLKDVGRVELGAQNYTQSCSFDGHPSVGLSVYQLPGTNALDVANAVRKKMKELSARFPDDLVYDIGYDTTPFIRESVMDVVKTLLEAVALVGLVVLVFLQDWRAMILPLIDVPVSIIGTFAAMAALGFSLNNISLFGLVLAIGIVVDDAIVVLENIERMMAKGYDPRTAAIKAMDEVTGPIIAVSLVLCAVFLPCAFISGITGQFFIQFAVTIAVSTVISAINAVTMTPARAVQIFQSGHGAGIGGQPRREALPWWFFGILGGLFTVWLGGMFLDGRFGLPATNGEAASDLPAWLYWSVQAVYFAPGALLGGLAGWFIIHPVNAALGWCFRLFNRGFDWMTDVYAWMVGASLRFSAVMLLGYAGLLALTWWAFQVAPTGFIPQQDQGRLIVSVQMPDSYALEQTLTVLREVDRIARVGPDGKKRPGIAHTVGMGGTSFLLQANSSNFASMFIVLDPFDQRQDPKLRDTAIMATLTKAWAESPIVRDAQVRVLGTSPIPGLGTAGGFKLIVEDRGGLGLGELQKRTQALVKQLKDVPGLNNVSTQFRSNTPQLYLDIDRAKVASLGVSLDDVNQTLDMYLGSLYVNSYNDFGRHWQVTIQAEGKYRQSIDDVALLQVRNNRGQMVPLGTLLIPREQGGPLSVPRYNLYTSAAISGNILGVSSGEAIKEIERIADKTLPLSMKSEWTDIMFMQVRAGNTAMYIFLLSIICVFLALSALYESWTLPLAVILVVPLCLLSSLAGVLFTSLFTQRDVNIFVQIGLVVLVGLACKNAILIVEYAKQLHQEGRSVYEATREASRLRLRPILMTSFAFIFGVVPLMIASGAGAEMRRSLGAAVFSGMLGVTLFGIFLTPVFFHVIQGFGENRLFEGVGVRRAVSCTVGALSGTAIGWLLGLMRVVLLPWGPIVGAVGGFVILLGVFEIRRRIKQTLQPALVPSPPIQPNAALDGEAAPPKAGTDAPADRKPHSDKAGEDIGVTGGPES